MLLTPTGADQLQWQHLGVILRKVSRSLPRLRRARYSDLIIARLYFWQLLQRVHEQFTASARVARTYLIDGKPLNAATG